MHQTRHLLLAFLFNLITLFTAIASEVPAVMEFAGMTLHIQEQARRKIQKEVDALTGNPKYFNLKVERIDLYFPIIEKVLEEEGLPDDFKYLAIQESSLISDAVSKSNAVGYWQFKKASALEVGMVIDGSVDERKHIVQATRGAARYLKRNNNYLQNWVYTLLSYNMGLGGTQRMVNKRHIGAGKMNIDGSTHWYIIKFLAHKLAFEDAIGKSTRQPLVLLQYPDCEGKTLKEIAQDMEVPLYELELYNKWLHKNKVPENKDHIVIIPAPSHKVEMLQAKLQGSEILVSPVEPEVEEKIQVVAYQSKLTSAFPVLKEKKSSRNGSSKVILYTINGKPGIQAQPGDNSAKLAEKAGMTKEKFLSYNDLKSNESLIPGEVYYLRRKRNKAAVQEHIVTEGETLWKVSQMYGITLKALLRKNRMKRVEKLKHGRVLWLRDIRPSDSPVEIKNIPKPPTTIASEPAPKTESKQVIEQTASELQEKQKSAEVVSKSIEPISTATEIISTDSINTITQNTAPVKDTLVASVESHAESDADTTTKIVEAEPEIEGEVSATEVSSNTYKTHVVTTGQTLFAIAKLYNVTVAQLRLWNNLQETEGIQVEQVLLVSPPATVNEQAVEESSPEFEEYTVQAGDSLYKIAKLYTVSVQELQDWNGKATTAVAIGEKLKIKQKK